MQHRGTRKSEGGMTGWKRFLVCMVGSPLMYCMLQRIGDTGSKYPRGGCSYDKLCPIVTALYAASLQRKDRGVRHILKHSIHRITARSALCLH